MYTGYIRVAQGMCICIAGMQHSATAASTCCLRPCCRRIVALVADTALVGMIMISTSVCFQSGVGKRSAFTERV